jgi:hypothetical protein
VSLAVRHRLVMLRQYGALSRARKREQAARFAGCRIRARCLRRVAWKLCPFPALASGAALAWMQQPVCVLMKKNHLGSDFLGVADQWQVGDRVEIVGC